MKTQLETSQGLLDGWDFRNGVKIPQTKVNTWIEEGICNCKNNLDDKGNARCRISSGNTFVLVEFKKFKLENITVADSYVNYCNPYNEIL